jgi:thiol:disulfide interchange protein
MTRTLVSSVLALTAVAGLAAEPASVQSKVEVKVVKYPELAQTIKQLKGKVIVMDLWADW